MARCPVSRLASRPHSSTRSARRQRGSATATRSSRRCPDRHPGHRAGPPQRRQTLAGRADQHRHPRPRARRRAGVPGGADRRCRRPRVAAVGSTRRSTSSAMPASPARRSRWPGAPGIAGEQRGHPTGRGQDGRPRSSRRGQGHRGVGGELRQSAGLCAAEGVDRLVGVADHDQFGTRGGQPLDQRGLGRDRRPGTRRRTGAGSAPARRPAPRRGRAAAARHRPARPDPMRRRARCCPGAGLRPAGTRG